ARLDPMAQTARTLWQGERVADIYIEYPDDKGGVVWLYKSVADQVSSYNMPLQFSVGEGALISTYQTSLGYDVQNVLAGMHLIFFEHWTLRWLYFLAGTAGCIMIATGYIYWLETRRKEHARQGRRSVRFVEGFAIWGIMGLMAATAAFFFINRALPPGLWTWQSIPKPFLEPILFMLVWLCALLHGWVRGPKAWFDQAVLISFLLFGAVCLNWLITGDHPLRAMKDGKTAILVMDVLLLCFAAIALAAGMRLRANLQAAGAHATKAAKNVKIGSVRPQ
ncbi:MAG: PepSY domain-containing protein, partial [Pseudomonadota bacterium]